MQGERRLVPQIRDLQRLSPVGGLPKRRLPATNSLPFDRLDQRVANPVDRTKMKLPTLLANDVNGSGFGF